MTKKNFMAIVSILLLAVLFFSGQASAVNASRPAKYNASEWQGWVSQYGGNCYLFVANLLSIENRPSIRGRFTGGATISGYTPIDGGQVIIGVNRTSISPDDVKSIFANANVGYVVQMYWHWSYNSPHTAIVSAIDDNGVEFLQANYSAGKITNNYLSWSKLASVYNAAGNGGGASVYYLDASSSAPPNPSPTPIPTPGPTPPSGIEITSPSELPGTTKGTYFGYYLQCTGEGSTSWEKISGSLPSGIDLDRNSGQLYGYPGEIGTFTFTVKASNNGGTGTKEFTLTVSNGSSSTPTPPPSSSIEITTDSTLPSDSKGADYDFVFHCTGNGNTKWEKSGGSFPPDLQLDINSGRLWGHLNAAGTYTFKLIARNDSGVAEKTFSITIRDPNSPEITTDSVLPGGRTGAEGYDFYFHCTGNGNTKWEKSGGSFPPDLQFHELSGRLYGRFANNSAGTYRFKLIARNDSGAAEKEFSLTVKDSNAPEIKTDSNLTPGVRGNDYSCTFQSAGSGNISWEKIGGSFPPDLQFNGNSGRLSGHLNSSGTYTFTLRARNNLGTDERTFTLVVSVPEFVFTGSVLNDGIVGQQYAKSISVSGGVSPYTWETGGNIPEGLSFTSSGGTAQLSGTPSKSGEYNFSVKASDNEGRTLTKNYTVKVTQTVLTGTLPDGIKGGVYRGTLSAEGGKEPYTWTAAGTSLPDGLSLNPRTGEISGTPTQAGVYTFTVEVQDSNGVKSANTFTVDITQSTITGRPTNGVVKKPYSATLTVSGGKTPYAWTNAGKTLPAGLELTVSGDKAVLSGTPTKAGTYTLTLKITDGNNTEITENFSVKITKTTVKATIPNAIIRGVLYTWTPKASGGTSAYTWSISSGTLPTGMTIDKSTGKITGKSTSAGTYNFTVKAVDKNKVAGTKAFTVKVTQTTVKATIPATIVRGASYTWTPKASGGTADYTWSISSGKLPNGMSINASTGKITGKPTKAWTFTFTVKAVDKNGVAATVSVSMIVIDLSSIAGNAGKSAENTETSQTDSVSDETSQSGESKLQERPLDLSTGTNTDVNIRATLSVASDDVVESYEGKDSDMVKVKADKPLTFIIGKWPEEVESVTVYVDDKAVEGVTVTEGVFTLPAELVHNDFKVSAKAGKLETEEVFIISE